MSKSKAPLFAALLIVLLIVATSDCPTNVDRNMNLISEITYSFRDSSVPPQDHRSYTITINAGTIRVVVDSYGDILADQTYEITDQQFSDVRNLLDTLEIGNCTGSENEDCTGGTTEVISWSDGEVERFIGSVYHCAGQDSGDLCGDIESFAEALKGLIPNFAQLIK